MKRYKNQNSSPGPHDIPAIFIQKLPYSAQIAINNIYNEIQTQNKFPTGWIEAIIVPILKQSKNKMDAESYRSISLTVYYV